MTPDLQQHSPLGGSGAYRWMPCPGSVRLSYGIEDEDGEYTLPGLQAHALAEYCLKKGVEPWRLVRADLVVDAEMADAVQVYISAIKETHSYADDFMGWVELEFHCPTIHEYFWGKSDYVYLYRSKRELHPWEYKHGVGMQVEVIRNPQLMYYAAGVLEKLDLWDEVDKVVLHVTQPRGFHWDGPVREWALSTEELRAWVTDELVPAMNTALHPIYGQKTASGDHCRFCPARGRACPQITKDFDELEQIMIELSAKDSADELTNEQCGRLLDLLEVAKIAGTQVAKTAFNRMVAGHEIPGRKLVNKRANRAWKEPTDLVTAVMFERFGKDAFTSPELKPLTQIEKMPGGKELVAQHVHKPDAGKTTARDSDVRAAIHADVAQYFVDQTAKDKEAKKEKKR